jgi:Fe-S-cluster containining protein
VNDEEVAAIAKFRGESAAETRAMFTRLVGKLRSLRERANGDCIFYDRDKGCTVYPVRPPQCRTWPFWESNVETSEAWQRTRGICPGSGRGELIPAEEITLRVNTIRL